MVFLTISSLYCRWSVDLWLGPVRSVRAVFVVDRMSRSASVPSSQLSEDLINSFLLVLPRLTTRHCGGVLACLLVRISCQSPLPTPRVQALRSPSARALTVLFVPAHSPVVNLP